MNRILSVFRRTERVSQFIQTHWGTFECSSSFSANLLQTIEVKSANQGVFHSVPKDTPLPSKGDLQAMINSSKWVCSFPIVREMSVVKIIFSKGSRAILESFG
ncbi:hypothetical protein AVEN_196707-1 [Araneus ventricosus]|uniref:Uncharacterized protein n=1 Tax=Araneus ventricosus TaxID=182803 RepID=A0A4Y2GXH9_ARAVE|nr:hypothetical protein AVEN_196707-1 [Araneus ventricosus]